MSDKLLIINAGSSSLKFRVYGVDGGQPQELWSGQLSGIGTQQARLSVSASDGSMDEDRRFDAAELPDLKAAQAALMAWLDRHLDRQPAAAGHRIVHGGADFSTSVVIDAPVRRRLERLTALAPLHQPHNLAPIDQLRQRWPDMLQVGCFDTAFHHGHCAVAEQFALPRRFYDAGVRRYGFHGLSYQYIAERLHATRPRLADGRVIVAHLGSGASACALVGGRSVDSTMGFTPLDGLPMATRPGTLDPGVVLWMQEQGMGHDEIQQLLYRDAGLKGLSGIGGDMRELLASQEPAAALAIAYFNYRVAQHIAGLCVASGGIDGLVFTAGIGELAPAVRAGICAHLQWLGIDLDAELNARNAAEISTSSSAVKVLVEATNEEFVIADQTATWLARTRQQTSQARDSL